MAEFLFMFPEAMGRVYHIHWSMKLGKAGLLEGRKEVWFRVHAVDHQPPVAVGTTIADRPRTEPYVRVYAYGSHLG